MTASQTPEQRVAIVTGAAKQTGMGRATALALSADGVAVVATDIDTRGLTNRGNTPADSGEESWNGLESLVAEITGSGGVASMVLGDVSDESDVRRIVDYAIEQYGRVDIVANIAAAPIGIDGGDVVGVSTEAWDKVMAVNARGPFLLSRETIQYMREQRWGRILTLSSDVALKGGSGRVAYAASKAAVLGMTKALASDVAPWGITVNAVLPGWIATSRVRSFVRALGVEDVEAGLAEQGKKIMLQRVGWPADIASTLAFLASDAAEWITGQGFVVDGGGLGNG